MTNIDYAEDGERPVTPARSARQDRTRVRFVTAMGLIALLLALSIPSLGNAVFEALLDAAKGFLYLVAR